MEVALAYARGGAPRERGFGSGGRGGEAEDLAEGSLPVVDDLEIAAAAAGAYSTEEESSSEEDSSSGANLQLSRHRLRDCMA